jgi:hypothetical protein
MQVATPIFARIEPDVQAPSGEDPPWLKQPVPGNRHTMQFELLRSRKSVAGLRGAVARLLAEVVPQPDASLTPDYFLAGLEPNEKPQVVACFEYGELIGVLYASELYVVGIRTGFIFGGDQMGRGLVLAAPDREQSVFTAACAFLLDQGRHAMRLNWTPQLPLNNGDLHLPQRSARLQVKLDVHPEGDWLRLEPAYEDFLARMGPHTRRNLRYYRRKVEGVGFTYSGALAPSEIAGALESLNKVADYPIGKGRLDRDRRYFAAFGTPVIAGLRDSRGNFISLVTGFTSGTHLHILTQLNGESEALRKLSLSLVLRGYLIEEFIQRGFTAVHFLQGSSPMLGRFCEPVDLQVVSIDDRRALMTPFKKVCSTLADAFRRRGRRIPYRLQRAAGSYLQ